MLFVQFQTTCNYLNAIVYNFYFLQLQLILVKAMTVITIVLISSVDTIQRWLLLKVSHLTIEIQYVGIKIKTVLLEYSHKVNVLLEHDECPKHVLLHTHLLCPKNGYSSLMATADKVEVLILCITLNSFIIWESSLADFFSYTCIITATFLS